MGDKPESEKNANILVTSNMTKRIELPFFLISPLNNAGLTLSS